MLSEVWLFSLILLACSLPESTPPAAPAAPAPPIATTPVSTVAPAGPTAPTAASGPAPTRIYVSFVSHNEERPNKQCTPILTDASAYAANRELVVKMGRAVIEHKAAWDMQSEWEYLAAVKNWDTDALKASTDGKNVIQWLGTAAPAHLVVDAHSHETSVNYADVVHMIEDLGAPRNGVVGGFIYYPPESEVWTRLKSELKGKKFPEARWKPEVLWGAGTFAHGGPDARASGIWRPKSAEDFLADDPSSSLLYYGNYQYSPEHDFTGVKELLTRLRAGELKQNHLYTASVFFKQCSLTDAAIAEMMAEVDALAPEVAAGNLVWSTITNTVDVWKREYQSKPVALEPMNEAVRPGGMDGKTGPRGPGGAGGQRPPRGPGGGQLPPGGGGGPPGGKPPRDEVGALPPK